MLSSRSSQSKLRSSSLPTATHVIAKGKSALSIVSCTGKESHRTITNKSWRRRGCPCPKVHMYSDELLWFFDKPTREKKLTLPEGEAHRNNAPTDEQGWRISCILLCDWLRLFTHLTPPRQDSHDPLPPRPRRSSNPPHVLDRISREVVQQHVLHLRWW